MKRRYTLAPEAARDLVEIWRYSSPVSETTNSAISRQPPKPNLRCVPGPWYFSTMSANEVLEYVKALPPRERRKFFAGVHELEAALEVEPAARRKRPIRWPDAAARRRRISGDKVLPNLVMLAREQERY